MLKLKNKFVLILGIILFLLSAQFYISYSKVKIDTNSYAVLIEGTATLNEADLKLNDRSILESGDILKTGASSLLAIEWGDGSITRLGENTIFSVKDVEIMKDLSKINISGRLESGKAWSKVTTAISEESNFNMYFYDLEAGVRGTVFDVDLDTNTVFVSNHEVELKKESGQVYQIGENKPFSISTFSFIDLQEFLSKIRDKAWEDLNKKLDKEFFLKIKEKAINNLDNNSAFSSFAEIFFPKYKILSELRKGGDIEQIKTLIKRLSEKQKIKLYTRVFNDYQYLNDIPYSDDLYARKMLYKEVLILLDEKNNRNETLVKYTLFDIQDTIEGGKFEVLESGLSFLERNKTIVEGLNIDLSGYINKEIIPSNIKDILFPRYEVINSLLPADINEVKGVLDTINEKAKEKINENLDNIIKIINK